MSLRQIQRRSAALLRDGGLLQALRAELNHELSSSPPQSQNHQVGSSVMGFKWEWDDPRAQDVVLRRHGDAEGEEIAVSAMLGPLRFDGEHALPRNARMKVCIKKTGLEPVFHFDCSIFRRQDEELVDGFGYGSSDFTVKGAYYHPSVDCLGVYKYRGPRFSSLDPQLQKALKEYLVARGIGEELTHFLIEHLHRKEHGQYVNWLRTLEGAFAKDA
ncbi:uncharacterized protein [Elaeis guineensis]|uniref:Uncharacterized protein LOC105045589 n=1 Tax=Elaeis guineensis var. tenera TaxID=51953 RepID=A0A6I9R7V5_ELAGV|nr:uncharacterized protein LOC105045589 [Elaeis guineensis]